MKNNILVIIVAYNSMKWADRCYLSLRNSSVPCDILTVDNGSTDGTPEYIRQHFPEVTLYEAKQNLGFGRANNLGLQKVLDEGYDYAYLLNQDAWIEPDTFSNLIAISQKHTEYGVLSPLQMQADLQHMDDRFVTYVIGENQKKRPYLIEDFYFNRLEDVYETSFVMAAHWFITRQCLQTVGGFSPTFFHYGEDNNYLQRVRYWKMKVGIVPTARAVHDRENNNWSSEKMLYVMNYTQPLVKASNPLGRCKTSYFIKQNLKQAIRLRNKRLFDYAFRLYKERKQIIQNFRLSLNTCAFLNQ